MNTYLNENKQIPSFANITMKSKTWKNFIRSPYAETLSDKIHDLFRHQRLSKRFGMFNIIHVLGCKVFLKDYQDFI